MTVIQPSVGPAKPPANRFGVVLVAVYVLGFLGALPLLPCSSCSSSRADVIRYSRLPGLSESDAATLRRYANSRERCSRCVRGRMSVLHWVFE